MSLGLKQIKTQSLDCENKESSRLDLGGFMEDCKVAAVVIDHSGQLKLGFAKTDVITLDINFHFDLKCESLAQW